jgi:[acyl-carrier-protein] S-malonyltransferase
MVNNRMIRNVAFLFPGQGAQFPGMALDLLEASSAVKKLFDTASSIYGKNMETLLKDSDEDTLKRSDVSQPAITLANLASAVYLEEKGIIPAACAGFSLGEYAALAVAKVITIEDCFVLVTERGKVMQAAADKIAANSEAGAAPGMAAVIGLAPEQVEALVAEWTASGLKDLYAVNFNSSKQVVVSGSAAALTEAETRFKEAGARRVIRLAVAGPFHSPMISEAADAFAPMLESINFADPAIPLFSNVTGKQISSGAEAKKLALRQITEPVRWTNEEAAIAALNVKAVLECGPGKVLQGLWKDTGSLIPAYAAGTLNDIENTIKIIAEENLSCN